MAAPMTNMSTRMSQAFMALFRLRPDFCKFYHQHQFQFLPYGLASSHFRIVGHQQHQNRTMCYDVRKVDIMAGKQTFMFDTHALIKALESQGFTTQQAEAVNDCLLQVLSANSEHQVKNMVTKSQQEIMMQQVMAHIASVRKDMVILEKSEFSQLKHEYEKQSIEIVQLKQTLQDEVQKLKGGMSLDLSLEKARSREDHSVNERNLSKLDNRIDMNHTETEKLLANLDNKIDKEIANLIATYERYKNDTIKYAAGTILTCLTVCLGFYRLWKV